MPWNGFPEAFNQFKRNTFSNTKPSNKQTGLDQMITLSWMSEEIPVKFDINKIPYSIKGKVKPPVNYIAIYVTANISCFIFDGLWQRYRKYIRKTAFPR